MKHNNNKEIEAMLFLNAFKKANKEFEKESMGTAWLIIGVACVLFIYLFIPFTR